MTVSRGGDSAEPMPGGGSTRSSCGYIGPAGRDLSGVGDGLSRLTHDDCLMQSGGFLGAQAARYTSDCPWL